MSELHILDSKLSLDSDIPLYTQLVGIIKHHISWRSAGGRVAAL